MTGLPARLLVVTDRHQAAAPLAEVVAGLVAAGAGWVWLRDRDLAPAERRGLAEQMRHITRAAGAALTIGADATLAAAVGAEGLQCRSGSDVPAARRLLGARALIGVSAHGEAEAWAAREAGADYVTLSPIFASPSKPGYGPALGLAAIERGARAGLPILALGGVTVAAVEACRAAGAAGVALMGPPMRAPDPLALITALHAALA